MNAFQPKGIFGKVTHFCGGKTALKAAERAFKAGHSHRAQVLFNKVRSRGVQSPRIYLRLGEILLQSGKKEEALAMLRQGVEAFPLDQECCRAYVELLRLQGRLQEAAPVFEKNVRENPDSPIPRNYQGVLAYLEGDLPGAKQIWEEIVQRWPKFAGAFGNLAGVHTQEGLFNQAFVELEVVLELEPAYAVMPLTNMAEICILRGDYLQAQRYLLNVIRVDPGDRYPFANLGHCYYALNETEKAIEAYEKSLENSRLTLAIEDIRVEVIPNLVKLYLRSGRIKEALLLAEQHLKEYPQDTRLMLLLGQYHFQQGNFQETVEILEKVREKVAAGPGLHLTHRYLALAYYKLGQLDKAIQQYKLANSYGIDCILPGCLKKKFVDVASDITWHWAMATQHAEDARSCRRAAMAYVELGAFDEAKEHFHQALSHNKEDVASYTCLGLLELATGDFFPALWNFGRAVEIDPRYAPAHVGMGMAYLWRGGTDAAIIKFKWALSLDPDNAPGHHYLGVAYERKGMFQEAAEAYQRAAGAEPDYMEPRYYLARLKKKTDPDQAETILHQIVRHYPGYVPAMQELMVLMQEQGRNLEAEVLKLKLSGEAVDAGNQGLGGLGVSVWGR